MRSFQQKLGLILDMLQIQTKSLGYIKMFDLIEEPLYSDINWSFSGIYRQNPSSCPGLDISPYFLDACQGKGFGFLSHLGKGN